MVLFYAKIFSRPIKYFLNLSRWSGSVLTVYVIQLAAKLITIISSTKLLTSSPGAGPAQAENCWAVSGAEINVVSEKNGQVNTFTG